MRHFGSFVLVVALTFGCTRAHPKVVPTNTPCVPAFVDSATVAELQRTIADTAIFAELRRMLVDTAMFADLRRMLADKTRMAELRRLMADTAWVTHMRPLIADLQEEVARLGRCSTI